MGCTHDWEPEPGERGRYRCAACEAPGSRRGRSIVPWRGTALRRPLDPSLATLARFEADARASRLQREGEPLRMFPYPAV